MADSNNFKFYSNFLYAIDKLPEDKRAKACYEFCKFGITGQLPEDENLSMFCVGVSASVQKYQGRGGNNNPSGKNQWSNEVKSGQKGQYKQTKTKTETKTKTKTETIKEKFDFGSFEKVMNDWLDYKKDRKEKYQSDKSVIACFNKLKKMSNDNPKIAQDIVNQSIANNWAGLFELKKQNNKKTQGSYNNYSGTYREDIPL